MHRSAYTSAQPDQCLSVRSLKMISYILATRKISAFLLISETEQDNLQDNQADHWGLFLFDFFIHSLFKRCWRYCDCLRLYIRFLFVMLSSKLLDRLSNQIC